ncbi:hypothetical protein TCAL_17148 [Tigriopus californicus]|uniref:Uncharacterized protein n=1 Tax=Tigriopus californicus TaxID=6832 RepID=A0A553P2X2_TIGCA|nr:hypothetical protein TCAL_17148 [Tigriopus californicus]
MASRDLFLYAGHTYLFYVDRFSGWPAVNRWNSDPSTDQLLPVDLSDIPTRRHHAQERSRAHADVTAVSLAPLSVGDHIRIQNHLTKLWDDTGWVTKKRGRPYLVRSSNTRLKWRNRRFIRPFYEEVVQDESQTPVDLPTTEPLKRKSPRNPKPVIQYQS